jgi:Tfp pilus assembly protein PilE
LPKPKTPHSGWGQRSLAYSAGVSLKTAHGLTFVEVAAALVMVAVALAIAVPMIESHALHQRRAEAVDALDGILEAQERFYLHHSRYAASLTDPPPMGLGLATRSSGGRYTLTLEVNDPARPSAFTARAAGVLGEHAPRDALCAHYSLNQNGVRDARDAAGVDRTEECWR